LRKLLAVESGLHVSEASLPLNILKEKFLSFGFVSSNAGRSRFEIARFLSSIASKDLRQNVCFKSAQAFDWDYQ